MRVYVIAENQGQLNDVCALLGMNPAGVILVTDAEGLKNMRTEDVVLSYNDREQLAARLRRIQSLAA